MASNSQVKVVISTQHCSPLEIAKLVKKFEDLYNLLCPGQGGRCEGTLGDHLDNLVKLAREQQFSASASPLPLPRRQLAVSLPQALTIEPGENTLEDAVKSRARF